MGVSAAKDFAAIVGPAVAVLSLAFNAYLAYRLHYLRSPVAQKSSVRDALITMLKRLESRLLKIPPPNEVWSQGFESLRLILESIRDCRFALMSVREGLVPNDISAAVRDLEHQAEALYYLQDSHYRFEERLESRSSTGHAKDPPHDRILHWEEMRTAENLLSNLQHTYREHKKLLEVYLKRLQ